MPNNLERREKEHLNQIEPNKKDRLPQQQFQALLNKALNLKYINQF